jgi:hypothetical protein
VHERGTILEAVLIPRDEAAKDVQPRICALDDPPSPIS